MAEEGNLVVLNVYDLSQGLARQLSTSFLGKAIEGIWHTGVVVYGNEYYFGGGIQSCPQGQTPYGKPIKVVELGYTEVPKEVFEEYLQEIKPRYTEQTYSLLHHNCNNFSDEISQFLVGVSIPEYILKLPQEVMNSPMGALIMPMIQQFETILRFGGVPQPPHLVQGANSASPFATTGRTVTSTIANGSVKQSVNQATVTTLPDAPSELLAAPKSSTNEGSEAYVKMPDKVSIDSASEPKDPLGEARQRVQQEITREFAALMAEGQYRASEAAALAARRVMERHGRGSGLISES